MATFSENVQVFLHFHMQCFKMPWKVFQKAQNTEKMQVTTPTFSILYFVFFQKLRYFVLQLKKPLGHVQMLMLMSLEKIEQKNRAKIGLN